MGGLFSKPSAPAPAPAPIPEPKPAPEPAPTVDTPAVQAAADAERMRERKASGRASTMLTKRTQDDELTNPRVGTTKLLGG